ncbi:DUF4242 domain-containing protein [Blastococcus sp. Marseille-P5729]|uniref:DUF4242 domain-containing protein n=1 Tax=Blastococcus sp. Marseille-P5729 TaxID=2086582 RepID=UPI000D10EE76|nr:DUF4242 domain-containing protein [Blastococcus sp. Marseille-P5729]
MSESVLALVEIVPATASKDAAAALIEQASTRAAAAGAELIEAEVTAPADRVFLVFETADLTALGSAVLGLDDVTEVEGPDQVRLVGADLEDIKAARPEAGYLVEWDIPAHIDMDTYLSRKKEKSPLYAEIPEVSFLRTYVREDVAKCLCLYNAPDEDAVVRAREIVSTPIDRLHALDVAPVPGGAG